MKLLRAWRAMTLMGHLSWLCLFAVIVLSICAEMTSSINHAGMFSTFALIALAGMFCFGMLASRER